MLKVSVIGASGYSGLELVKLLGKHPYVALDRLFAGSSAGERLEDIAPWFSKKESALLTKYEVGAADSSDVVFMALPAGEAMKLAPDLLRRGNKIVDLSGDFRLRDTAEYAKFYGREHTASELLPTGVYGLPEWNRKQVSLSALISNPGCYPTSAILPLAPLLKESVIEPAGIVINSMSGVSGAGKKATLDMSFSEVNETVKAYKVGDHQHTPEIRSVLTTIGGTTPGITFVPHLIPITRGIYTSTYARLRPGKTGADVKEALRRYYGDEPFVRLLDQRIPEIKHVLHTNYIDIGFRVIEPEGAVVLMSVIDNLLKGAAGQAVQNMNVMCGFDEVEGLP